MKIKIIAVAVCLICLSSPAHTTGLLEAKIAAVAGVAKGAALLGAGALAAKGAVLKGVGSLLSAKGAAIKNVLDAVTPVEVPVPTIVIQQPAPVSQPCAIPNVVVEQPSVVTKPCVVPVPVPNMILEQPATATSKPNAPASSGSLLTAELQTPILSAGVELDPKPVVSLLSDRLNGLLTTVDNTIGTQLNKTLVLNTVQSPVVYRILQTPKYYPVPIY